MSEVKLCDETHRIGRKRGNGLLRREVWVDASGAITRYNLAYINHLIYSGDNGRVLGFDNKHGHHHRHFKGTTAPVEFATYEDIERRFEQEWVALLMERQGKR